MGMISLGAGIAIGYVIGTKTGQNTFERGVQSVRSTASETWHDPKVQDAVRRAEETTNNVAHDVTDRAKKAATAFGEAVRSGASQAADTAVNLAAEAEQAADAAAQRAEGTAQAAADRAEAAAADLVDDEADVDDYLHDDADDHGEDEDTAGEEPADR